MNFGLPSTDLTGHSVAIERTFLGSTVVRIFDDNSKISRPQIPSSFITNSSWMGQQSIMTPVGFNTGRKDFKFYSVRASRVGKPIAITIEPPAPERDGTPALVSTTQMQGSAFAYTNEAYSPFPANSPKQIYTPVSYRDSNGTNYSDQQKRYMLNSTDDSTSTSSSSSSDTSSSDSSNEEGKKIFSYLEFALVSVLVNPIFGIAAVILSISSRMKAKRKLYNEALWEGRFALLMAGLGIFFTMLAVVLVVLYFRTNALCDDC